jgi:diguanylate cyclase (GGDEF)-like protein
LAEKNLVGVLTLYSDIPLAFSEDHRRLIEMISRQLSRSVAEAIEVDRSRASSLCDKVTGLPNLRRLNQLVTQPDLVLGLAGHPVALLLLDVVGLEAINRKYGTELRDSVLSHISIVVRNALRAADILFRSDNNEFLVLLTQTDIYTAHSIAERIIAQVTDVPYVSPKGVTFDIALEYGVAADRSDGRNVGELINDARRGLGGHSLVEGSVLPTIH